MEKRNTKKRAFTLAELAVVLAVIAIATTMVVSFTALVGNRRAVSQQKLDAFNEIRLVEALVENYIEKKGDTNISFDAESGILTLGTDSDKQEISLERVTEINISEPKTNSGITLYSCTLTYEVADKEDTYTFCVLHKEDGGSNP